MILISLHMLQLCQPLAPRCCFTVSPILLPTWIMITGTAPQLSPLYIIIIPSALLKALPCLQKLLHKQRLHLIKMHPPREASEEPGCITLPGCRAGAALLCYSHRRFPAPASDPSSSPRRANPKDHNRIHSRLSFPRGCTLERQKDLLMCSQIASTSNQPFHNLTNPQGRDFSPLKTPTERPAKPL